MIKAEHCQMGNETDDATIDQSTPRVYKLRVEACLDHDHWSRWFDGMHIELTDEGQTIISGPVADQSALHGLLAKIRDLGLPLVAVQRVQKKTHSR